ncbi:MAG: hypothetical protein H8E36_07060 [Rhodospirillaceae bacterium]|jgi:hypothetical protein|nr:hypothetical protein [Rhodospirillaceae bacterium]MBL6941202.1 hypothetical protein [Rhodospirillales bacterium]
MAETLYICRVNNGFILANSANFGDDVKVAQTPEELSEIVRKWGAKETPLEEHLQDFDQDTILTQAEIDVFFENTSSAPNLGKMTHCP